MNKNKKIRSNERGLTLRGLAEVVVDQRNNGSHTKLRMHNTIADAAKRVWLTAGFADLSAGFGSMFGRPIVRSSMMNRAAYVSNGYPKAYAALAGYKNALSCALLGLPDAKYEDINGTVPFLPLLDATGAVDSNKVRALANVEATSALSDVGTVVLQDGASVVNLDKVGSKFEYAEGIGSGTVSGVAVIPGDWRPGKVPVGGQMQLKCLDPLLCLQEGSQSQGIVTPGVDGLGAAEIRVSTNVWAITRRKININTGEITNGAGTEWVPSYRYTQLYDDGSYIYGIRSDNNWIDRYDKNSSYSMSYTRIESNTSDSVRKYAKTLYVDSNSNVWGFDHVEISSTNYITGRRYDTETGQAHQLSKSDFAAWLSTTFGITVPSAWVSDTDVKYFCPMTLGNYTAFRLGTDIGEAIYICSDPTDVAGSLIDIIPCTGNSDCAWGVGTDYGIVSVGKSFTAVTYAYSIADGRYELPSTAADYSSSLQSGDSSDYATTANGYYANDNITHGMAKNVYGRSNYRRDGDKAGVYIARKGMWSCWNSCLKLTQDIDKTAETKMTVQYDYTVS